MMSAVLFVDYVVRLTNNRKNITLILLCWMLQVHWYQSWGSPPGQQNWETEWRDSGADRVWSGKIHVIAATVSNTIEHNLCWTFNNHMLNGELVVKSDALTLKSLKHGQAWSPHGWAIAPAARFLQSQCYVLASLCTCCAISPESVLCARLCTCCAISPVSVMC